MKKRTKLKQALVKPFSWCLPALFLIATLLSFVARAQTSEETPSQVSTQNYLWSQNDDLIYHFPSDKLSSIQVSINDKQIDVPFVKYNSHQAIVKGLVIILGDIQTQSQLDPSLHSLAQQLPQWGWHTLLVTPQQAFFAIEREEEREKQNDDNITSTKTLSQSEFPQIEIKPSDMQAPHLPYSHSDYLLFLGALDKALHTKFAQQPGYKLLYAKGKSASGLISLLNRPTDFRIDALVIDSPYWPDTRQNNLLPELISSLPMPVLDFISGSNNNWAKQTSTDRAIASKVGLKSLYRQREINSDKVRLYKHSDLAKELISWTYFLGW
jgi:hypothetical protein